MRTSPGGYGCYGAPVDQEESPNDVRGAQGPPARSGLRLAWSHPRGSRLPRPGHLRRPVAAPTRWRVNLAVAIELQLQGEYGLSDDDFLTTFSAPPDLG